MKKSTPKARPGEPEFPHISEFVRGYLHQDVIPEYGTAMNAAAQYLNDLAPRDKSALAAEVLNLRSISEHWNVAQINEHFRNMGSAVAFKSSAEFVRLLALFS